MGWFSKDKEPVRERGAAPTARRAPPPPARGPEFEDSLPPMAAANEESAPKSIPFRGKPEALPSGELGSSQSARAAEMEHIATFARVPKFLNLLSAGDSPVIEISKADKDRVAVIEMTGRAALVIHDKLDQSMLGSIIGTLRSQRYQVRIATADAGVIKEVYLAGSKSEAGVAGVRPRKSEYMRAAQEWIEYAVKNRATDIHMETRGTTGMVRFRVDGEMEAMRADHEGKYPSSFIESVMTSLFNNEQMAKSGSDSMFERSRFLYCMIPYNEIPDHTLKLRFQSLKGNEGPKAVMRLLHVDENLPTLTFEQLGYAPSQVALWKEAMDTPSGMVKIAGVTGSGKSTTLKSFIELNPHTPTSNVITIEDPVEYPIRGAHQIPVQRDLANPNESAKRFGEAISSIVRADPDIVMVGEIRDRFSSSAAQQLAETGHMGLGTVHAHLLSGIVPRLVNPEIGMTRQILTAPNMITLLGYQALVPKLCPYCAARNEDMPTDWRIQSIIENVRQLGLDPSALRWKRIGGCDKCHGRGTYDQTVVAEMLMPDEDWLRPVREGKDTDAVLVYRSRSNGDLTSEDMTGKTVFEHCLHKALKGLVDARHCSAFDTWQRYMHYRKNMRSH